MDGDGNIVEVNAATETTFGYSAEEMVGRELAELMIPPGKLREDHRRGLRRYMDTGASRIVGHPVELTAMRADGSTFPVELAVTRPDLPGPALFCGYLRDVTERRRAERALQGMAEEQAALRRVATAVAAEVEPERLFGLIAEEVGRALDAGIGNILRYNGDGTALVMGRVERGRRDDPGRHARSTSTATPSPRTIWRTHRPARYDSLEGKTGALADTLRSTGIKAAVGAPVIFAGDAVGRGDHLQRRRPLPARGRVPRRRLRRPRRPGHRQRPRARGARRLAHAHRRGQRRRAPAPGAQPPRRRPAAARRDVAGRAHGGPPRDRRSRRCARCSTAPATSWRWRSRSCASWRAGCIPPSSADHGLCAAIEAVADRAPLPVTVDVPLDERLPETVEAAAYFVVCEALTNVAKYAHASQARVRVERSDGHATVEVVDDGVGGADERGGSGLRGLADRVEALGGRLVVTSPAGRGHGRPRPAPGLLSAGRAPRSRSGGLGDQPVARELLARLDEAQVRRAAG